MASDAGEGWGARRHLEENPFFVLGISPDQPRSVVEREGQKLIGMLEVGLESAVAYRTPLGLRPRTPELVRWALGELRQPDRRLLHELWAAVAVRDDATDGGEPAGWPDARAVYGWEPRS